MANRVEFGDWQTNDNLSTAICQQLYDDGVRPTVIIEPTCGLGSFVKSAISVFNTIKTVVAIDINSQYCSELQSWVEKNKKDSIDIEIYHSSVFDINFNSIAKKYDKENVLLIGNPPWVTNSQLGVIGSDNLPVKSNINNHKGIEAITGKGNFDISESILYLLFSAFAFHKKCVIAFIVKNSVIKNIAESLPTKHFKLTSLAQYNINTQKEFGASVSAALLYARLGEKTDYCCNIYDFYTKKKIRTFGWTDNRFVADVNDYALLSSFDGNSPFVWRSGVKHDCAKVMELRKKDGVLYNGLDEIVNIEEECIFPLIKSSDIKKDIINNTDRYIIITQNKVSEDTSQLENTHPNLWKYLLSHKSYFTNRKSAIYRSKPQYSIFGIGEYSFCKYKIAISGLYKTFNFTLLEPIEGKPVMIDDTCYSIGFDNKDTAIKALEVYNSTVIKNFLRTITFDDAKRIISKEILMRIDYFKAYEVLYHCEAPLKLTVQKNSTLQLQLF